MRLTIFSLGALVIQFLQEIWFSACCSVFTDTLLTISHHLQKYLEEGLESYIVQLDFSAFDRVSHISLLFKLKSIGVGGSVLPICAEFLTHLSQRVVVEGAASEWISIISGMPQGCVLGPLI